MGNRADARRLGNNDTENSADGHVELHRIVLLGTGSTGKSTFYKQAMMHLNPGFSSSDLIDYKSHILSSFIYQFENVLNTLYDLCGNLPDVKLRKLAKKYFPNVHGVRVLHDGPINQEMVLFMKSIWYSNICRDLWVCRSDYVLSDSLSYFMENIDRISQNNYIPTEEDFLQQNSLTNGIMEQKVMHAGYSIELVDVGGTRPERRKWLAALGQADFIIFFASLASFDQVLYADYTTRQLPDSVGVFESTLRARFLNTMPYLLLFTKADLLKQKLEDFEKINQDLDEYFPELNLGTNYDGAYEQILQHIQNMYLDKIPDARRNDFTVHTVTLNEPMDFKRFFNQATRGLLHFRGH